MKAKNERIKKVEEQKMWGKKDGRDRKSWSGRKKGRKKKRINENRQLEKLAGDKLVWPRGKKIWKLSWRGVVDVAAAKYSRCCILLETVSNC